MTELTPMNRIEHFLQNITEAASGGGGSSLPPVTSADNGDVLTVVNGAWDKAVPAGGVSGLLVFDDVTGLLNKTFGDILSLVENGTLVFFITANDVCILNGITDGGSDASSLGFCKIGDPLSDVVKFEAASHDSYPEVVES